MDIIQLGLRFSQKVPYKKIAIWYATHIYKPFLINKGVRFISKYKEIYTTRLHVSILSTLIEKKHYIIDNSYGKNNKKEKIDKKSEKVSEKRLTRTGWMRIITFVV